MNGRAGLSLIYRNPGLRTPGSQPVSDRDYWPRFTVPELEYKVLSLNLTTGRALKADECYFWNTYVVQLRTMLGKISELCILFILFTYCRQS